jgi:hypothetical protein
MALRATRSRFLGADVERVDPSSACYIRLALGQARPLFYRTVAPDPVAVITRFE